MDTPTSVSWLQDYVKEELEELVLAITPGYNRYINVIDNSFIFDKRLGTSIDEQIVKLHPRLLWILIGLYHDDIEFFTIKVQHEYVYDTVRFLEMEELYTIAPYLFHPNFYNPSVCAIVLARYTIYNAIDKPDITTHIYNGELKSSISQYINENWITGSIKHFPTFIKNKLVILYCLANISNMQVLPIELIHLIREHYVLASLIPWPYHH